MCVALSAFLRLCKKPSDTERHPKARALLLSSFYHCTLLALSTLLTCDRRSFQKHLIAFQTPVTPTPVSKTPTQTYAHAAVSCPNTVYPLAFPPTPSWTNSSTTSSCWENNILCMPQQPTHRHSLWKTYRAYFAANICVSVVRVSVCAHVYLCAACFYMLN